jgi:hypothetical protein
MSQVDAGELALTGDGGFLPEMIKAVLERGLAAEQTAHLGCEKGDPAGRELPQGRLQRPAPTALCPTRHPSPAPYLVDASQSCLRVRISIPGRFPQMARVSVSMVVAAAMDNRDNRSCVRPPPRRPAASIERRDQASATETATA